MPRPLPDRLPPEVRLRLKERGYRNLADLADRHDLRRSTIYSVFLNSDGKTIDTLVRIANAAGISAERLDDILSDTNGDTRENRLREVMQLAGLASFNEWATRANLRESTLRSLKIGDSKRIYLHNARTAASLLGLTLEQLRSAKQIGGT